jgi:hypothetical protein
VRSLWVAVALLSPLPLMAPAAVALADHAGRELGVALAAVSETLRVQEREPPALVLAAPIRAATVDQHVEVSKPRARPVSPIAAAAPKKGVLVRAETVLRLARVRAIPGGVPVRAEGERPAGIALVGVSGLGVGLVDGDILTHAGGRPARCQADVIGMVIASRGANATQVTGRFWRAGEYYNLVVEQPYL